jgi:hypothetical protein
MTPERAKEIARKHGRRLEFGKDKGRYEKDDAWLLEVPHKGAWRLLAVIEQDELERLTEEEFAERYC